MTGTPATESKLAFQRRWNREHYPCKIKGCKFTIYTGDLCRKHYEMVPWEMRKACANAVMDASYYTAKRHHKRQFTYVRKLLSDSGEP